ncbi:hypothetical protein P4V86_19340 [Brevibacillus laterosporus]|uniref:hypothetical protein n=1 Tax=Brevibacillus laterosporus TaxID=1465 RepID=UPI000381F624|nr:hypothetical protein [Brevibacillus laterosporus]ATO50127.1 hypothetical protein BrL25_14190 [Brevibacillus laterosporus DSM 25]MED2005477.1 hypothetical protein [Brevibacillus laterosporus]
MNRVSENQSDKLIQLNFIRLERNKERKCTCEFRKYTVDTVNREITCECGMVVDPFEAMLDMAKHYDHLNYQHRLMEEQRLQWFKEKPHSVLFKNLERSYQKGKMLPYCPSCQQLFDFKDVTGFGNAEFYRKLQKRNGGSQ